jgi:hypothetical protein
MLERASHLGQSLKAESFARMVQLGALDCGQTLCKEGGVGFGKRARRRTQTD